MGSPPTAHDMDAPLVTDAPVPKRSDYIPRKCSVTNCLLSSKDHASVQINVGHVDQFGAYTNDYSVYCLSGQVRRQGEADQGLNRLSVDAGFMNSRVLKYAVWRHPDMGTKRRESNVT